MPSDLNGARIARVSTIPYFVATQLKKQITDIAATGATVVVITSPGPELDTLVMENILVEHIEIPRTIKPLHDLIALFRLGKCLSRNKIDIIHSTTPKAGLLSAIAGAAIGIPIRLHTFTGQPWVNRSGPIKWLSRWADYLVARLDTHCYADSQSQKSFLITEGIVAADKISVLGQGSLAGIDCSRFDTARYSDQQKTRYRNELGISENTKIILFVGRITAEKGVRELITAFKNIRKTGIAVDLLLVGPLELTAEDRVAFDAASMHSDSHIHHIGYTETPEDYMALADFLCLPSYREGFGTVVIEAAAMGLPTLGTEIYGLSDAIEDGVTGVLVPPRDALALQTAMESLLDNPEKTRSMGTKARARCLEHFTAKQINSLLLQEYARFLARRQS